VAFSCHNPVLIVEVVGGVAWGYAAIAVFGGGKDPSSKESSDSIEYLTACFASPR
jgi:hypothetical protein